jgi:uncharacterized coiled-coil DUF342 family protein
MALTKEDLQAIAGLIQPLKDDMNIMKNDIKTLRNDIDVIKKDIDVMKNDIDGMKNDIDGMKNDIDGMKNDIDGMKNDIKNLDKRVTSLEVHLENITDKNIRIIAEGHLDLNRKLDDALKVENEKELLIIRVRILEEELKKVKDRLNQIA